MIFRFPFNAWFSTTVATAVAATAVGARGTEEVDIPATSLRKVDPEKARDTLVSSPVHAAAYVPDKMHGAAALGGNFEDVDEDGIEESLALENKTTKTARVLANSPWKEHTQTNPAAKGPLDDLDVGILGREEELGRGENQRNLKPANLNCNEIYIYIDGGDDFAYLEFNVDFLFNGSGQSVSSGRFTEQVGKVKVEACLVTSYCDILLGDYGYFFEFYQYDYPQCEAEGFRVQLYSDLKPKYLVSKPFEVYGSFVDDNKEGEPFPRQTIAFDSYFCWLDDDYSCYNYYSGILLYHTIPPLTGAPTISPTVSPTVSPTACRTKSGKSCKSGKKKSVQKMGKAESKMKMGKAESKMKMGKAESKMKMGKAESKMKMGKAESKMKMGKADSKMQKSGKS